MSLGDIRARFEIVPGEHRPKLVRAGLIGTVLFSALLISAVLYAVSGVFPLAPKDGQVVAAQFRSAADVKANSPVRVNGIDVGRVEKIALSDGGRLSLVKMRVSDDAARLLRADARAATWWRTALGGSAYIQLEPGTERAPLAGQTIPVARTTSQFQLDELLQAFPSQARKGLQGMVKGLRGGFSDAQATGHAVDALAPGLRPVAPALQALRGQNPGDLSDTVDGFSKVVSVLNRDERSLAGLVDDGSEAIGILAARHDDLQGLLERAPGALREARTQLAGLEGTADALDPLVEDLRPGVRRADGTLRALQPALGDTGALLRRARPLVRDLGPAMSSLATAARAGTPLMRELLPSVTRLKDSILPWLLKRDPIVGRSVSEMIGPTLAPAGGIAGMFDRQGHMVVFQAGASTRALDGFNPCTLWFGNSDREEKIACRSVEAQLKALLGAPPPASALLSKISGKAK